MHFAPVLPPSLLPSSAPPSGTVTFLFTDIEGSTALWEDHPDTMRAALAHHDSLFRAAIAAANGIVFHTAGDSFGAAFNTALEALDAAVAAQIALHLEMEGVPLRVRMALHTGAAEAREGNYYGQPLNRAARLMAVGHGGQILLSVACQELARDALPAAVTLRDLGSHRLKDLSRPEQVFQVMHPALPAEFPPLRSLDNPALPNNLPKQMTSFVGREMEVARIKTLLDKSRLLTLTGEGGAGKTRLALQAAADLLEGGGDGVWLVELAPLSGSSLVTQQVAEALGVREEPNLPLAEALVNFLKSKHLLLVLDNCEHVLAACAFLVSDLLRVCPHLSVLATSREALGVPGEQAFRVPSLSLPDPRQNHSPEALGQYEAIRLFVDRACLSQPSFAVTNQNAPAVAQICARLDGIPLALELAAARVRSLSVEQIGTRLDDRFRLLTGGSRTALPRQQTLKAAIDWSYDLLTGGEKTLLRRLSVFSGGWTLEAAEAVCADPLGAPLQIEWGDVLDLLANLVDKSLAAYEESDGQGRYRLLETVRQYGRDRLLESGEAEATRGRHQLFFLRFAEKAEPELRGPEQIRWLDRLELEHGNLRAALEWSLGAEPTAEASLRMAGALSLFWRRRSHHWEGQEWLNRALALAGQEETKQQRAKALLEVGRMAADRGNLETARAFYQQSLTLARQADDPRGVAWALLGVGGFAETDTAKQALFEESLTIHRQRNDYSGIAEALAAIADVANSRGDHPGAQALLEEALALERQRGNLAGIASQLLRLQWIARMQGDTERAKSLLEECNVLFQGMGDTRSVYDTLFGLAFFGMNEGDYTQARSCHEAQIVLAQQLKMPNLICDALIFLGHVDFHQNLLADAEARAQEALTMARQEGLLLSAAQAVLLQARVAATLGQAATVQTLLTEIFPAAQRAGNTWMLVIGLHEFVRLSTSQHSTSQHSTSQHSFVRAARLLGAIQSPRGAPKFRLSLKDRQERQQWRLAAAEALGEETFASAFAEGQAMALDEAVEYALAGTDG